VRSLTWTRSPTNLETVVVDVLHGKHPRQVVADLHAVVDVNTFRLVDEDTDMPATVGKLDIHELETQSRQ
jgi:hypothetical protein